MMQHAAGVAGRRQGTLSEAAAAAADRGDSSADTESFHMSRTAPA